MADTKDSEQDKLIFLRITFIGAGCAGKTSLVNSFVNNCCPVRYTKTDKSVIYYKKLEVIDDGEWEDIAKPILVELEDTPGSERGFDDDDGAAGGADGGSGPPIIKRGSRVTLMAASEKAAFIETFKDPKYKGQLRYRTAMDGMLGREYPVRIIGPDKSIGLPSPDGSEGGVWNFPEKAVKLKVSMDLPIDQFLNLGEKPKLPFKQLKERNQYRSHLQFPLSAYPRPVGNPDTDKTVTRNRMGYFICFDVSDESGESLKEAMSVYAMLMTTLQKSKTAKLKPIVLLIGCKSDRTSMWETIELNKDSAQAWSDQEEIPFRVTSAKNHTNVNDVFNEMLQSICSREGLWTLDAADDPEPEPENVPCYSQ